MGSSGVGPASQPTPVKSEAVDPAQREANAEKAKQLFAALREGKGLRTSSLAGDAKRQKTAGDARVKRE